MELTTTSPEQREASERRSFSWRTVVFGFLLSRRHEHRRGADNDVVFLDWHHPWLFFLAVGTMLLSSADAFLTLQLMERGMVEINPVMRAAMDQGTALFAGVKLGMTAAGVFVLVFLAKLRFLNRFRTHLFLTAFFSAYCCLVCYELVNLFQLM